MSLAAYLLSTAARLKRNRQSQNDAIREQSRTLRRLLDLARDTEFGKAHRFSKLTSVEEFQRSVPLRTYDGFWEEWWKPSFPLLRNVSWPGQIPYFAQSSGTATGATKYIPVTPEAIRSFRRAGLDVLLAHISGTGSASVVDGKSLVLGGSTDLTELAPDVVTGDLSGILAQHYPPWVRARTLPREEIALERAWEQKLNKVAYESASEDVRLISGVPTWLLMLFERLHALGGNAERSLAQTFPNLKAVVHGGVSFEPYRDEFKRWVRGLETEFREVYPASEGFIAYADRGPEDGLRLCSNHGIFFEFIPMESFSLGGARREWMATIREGVDYAIVVSTAAGLWCYLLGDTVRFVSLSPPRIVISGRVSYSLSSLGEHLIGEEIERAIIDATQAIQKSVAEFSVGTVFTPSTRKYQGFHRYYVEFRGDPPKAELLTQFVAVLDGRLKEFNHDYRIHREAPVTVGRPEIAVLKPGAFAGWMKSRGKLGGQHKVPRVLLGEAFASLERYMADKTVTTLRGEVPEPFEAQ